MKAEELWIKAAQTCSFEQEIKFLLDNCQTEAAPLTYVSQFQLFHKDGVVKCKGEGK